MLANAQQSAVSRDKTDVRPCSDKSSLSPDKQWRQENQQAISGYNQMVDKQGVFSEGLRAF